MPTATTLPLIVLMIVLWRITKGEILSCVLFTSIFTAASALNLGPLGIAPWLFVLAGCIVIKLVRGHRPYRFNPDVNRIALHLAILFLGYTAFSGFVYPVLFRGVTVMRLGDPEPLAWGLSNIAQLCYLAAAAVLYFLAVASTREQLREAIDWYVRGCITASLFAMYQLANAVVHVPYPDAVLYSNPSHVVYRAYMINGMWRLNSTFNEASEMAGFLIVGLSLLGWKMLTSPLELKRTLCFLLMLVSLLMTMSSVGYLCLGYMFTAAACLGIRHAIRRGGISPAKAVAGIVLLAGFVTLFTLSPKADQIVAKVITSTILDKKGTESYRERESTHVAALTTLAETHYMGAGWGSVRASGLGYILLGAVGVPGLVLFAGFLGSLLLPLFQPHLEQFSYRCSGIGRCQCGFSLKKSHVERIQALYSNRKTALRAGPSHRFDLIEKTLFAMSTLLIAMLVAGAEPVAPVLWVLFGVATVAGPSGRCSRDEQARRSPIFLFNPSLVSAPAATPFPHPLRDLGPRDKI